MPIISRPNILAKISGMDAYVFYQHLFQASSGRNHPGGEILTTTSGAGLKSAACRSATYAVAGKHNLTKVTCHWRSAGRSRTVGEHQARYWVIRGTATAALRSFLPPAPIWRSDLLARAQKPFCPPAQRGEGGDIYVGE